MHSHSHSYSNATSGGHGYTHAHAHSLPHPIITTTASSPPPPASPTSPSSSHASHSFTLSHSHSHSSLSQQPVSQLDVNPHLSAAYDEMDGSNSYLGDDISDDEYGTALNGSSSLAGTQLFHPLPRFLNTTTSGPSKPGADQSTNQAVMGKPITTNNFVTKLYQYATAFRRNHFQLTRPNG